MEERSEYEGADERRQYGSPDAHPVHRALLVDLGRRAEERRRREEGREDGQRHRYGGHAAVGEQELLRALLASAGERVVQADERRDGEHDREDDVVPDGKRRLHRFRHRINL